MEREDTPFFCGKNHRRRHGLRLIQGSGEEPQERQARRTEERAHFIKTNIDRFLKKEGFDDFDFDKSSVDAGLLEWRFNNFIELASAVVLSEQQEILQSVTFTDVLLMCEAYAWGTREAVRTLKRDAPQEVRDNAFPTARYAAEIHSVIQEAVTMTASEKAARRKIAIVQPDESPDEIR